MELVSKKKLMLFAGQGNEDLSQEIAECLDVPLGEVKLSTFANGEMYAGYGESVRGADVFIVQSHCEPINDRIMQQLLMIDAAKRASARRITAVCPFYGYARQDRKAEGREPISGAPARRPPHRRGRRPRRERRPPHRSDPGLLRRSRSTTSPRCRCSPTTWPSRSRATSVVVSPDAGGAKLAQRFANCLGDAGIETDLAFIDKRRPKGTHNVAEATEVVGNVAGHVCILIDDMIDTAGTVVSRRQPARRAGRRPRCGCWPPTACSRARPSTA